MTKAIGLPLEAVDSSRCLPDRRLTALPLRHMGLGITDLTSTADEQYRASTDASAYLVKALTPSDDAPPFSCAANVDCIVNAKKAHRRRLEEAHKHTIAILRGNSDSCLTDKYEKKVAGDESPGEWLGAYPTGRSDFLVSRDEYRVGICIRYGKNPMHLPEVCDGCGCANSLEHSLICRKGGLIDGRHRVINDVVGDICVKAFSNGAVKIEPPIFPPGAVEPGEVANSRGDISVLGLWSADRKGFIDTTISHTESPSYVGRTAAKVLLSRQQAKKKKYAAICHLQGAHFTPFALSTSGQLAPEASALLKRLAYVLTEKWNRPLAVIHRYIRELVSFAVVRACTHCVFGQRAHRFSGLPFEDGAGLPALQGPSTL